MEVCSLAANERFSHLFSSIWNDIFAAFEGGGSVIWLCSQGLRYTNTLALTHGYTSITDKLENAQNFAIRPCSRSAFNYPKKAL